jgi:KTSC domain
MIRSVGYEAESSVLEIEFTSRKIYRYSDVPETVYMELMSAGSKGRYFEEQIDSIYHYYRA